MVVQGELELGLVPTRAWDTEGVVGLRALNAPFLVTSDELLDRIITGPIESELLAALRARAWWGSRSYPRASVTRSRSGSPFCHPATTPSTHTRPPVGRRVRTVRGARRQPDRRQRGRPQERGGRGHARTRRVRFAVSGTLPAPTVATGNVTFFPKVNSLVINADALDGLDKAQQRILERGAQRDARLGDRR